MEPLKGILFIDIETVPVQPDYQQLTPELQKEWERKAKSMKPTAEGVLDAPLLFNERAGVFSEFAKVVCIGIGSVNKDESGWKMRLKGVTGHDEKKLLIDFCLLLERFATHHNEVRFCGHNIKEFDIPFLCRRMVINNVPIPGIMQLQGKKPWEINHLDTMELWRFGDYKNFTALSLLSAVLGIPSPKSDIDGSMVATVYYHEKDLPRISRYCLQDVYTSAKVYIRLAGIREIELQPVYVED